MHVINYSFSDTPPQYMSNLKAEYKTALFACIENAVSPGQSLVENISAIQQKIFSYISDTYTIEDSFERLFSLLENANALSAQMTQGLQFKDGARVNKIKQHFMHILPLCTQDVLEVFEFRDKFDFIASMHASVAIPSELKKSVADHLLKDIIAKTNANTTLFSFREILQSLNGFINHPQEKSMKLLASHIRLSEFAKDLPVKFNLEVYKNLLSDLKPLLTSIDCASEHAMEKSNAFNDLKASITSPELAVHYDENEPDDALSLEEQNLIYFWSAQQSLEEIAIHLESAADQLFTPQLVAFKKNLYDPIATQLLLPPMQIALPSFEEDAALAEQLNRQFQQETSDQQFAEQFYM